MMRGLNANQIAFFLDQGYLLVEDVLPETALQPLVHDIEQEIERRAVAAYASGRLSHLFEKEAFDRRLARIGEAMEDAREVESAVTGKRLRTAGMFALMTHPVILDIVQSVIGPEILAHPQFNCQAKMPEEQRSQIPWHQDLGFLNPEAEETMMVNFWIPLVDATVENGCLEVMPGSHKKGLKPHGDVANYVNTGILKGRVPPGKALPCPVRKGGLVLFQHRTVHRSFPNRTRRIRWSVDVRYCDPCKPTGRNEVPGFIARSRVNPECVARSHLDWQRMLEGVDMAQYE